MDSIQALILGLVQGLTEYLPVSSSGHLEIGKVILGEGAEAGGLTFDIVVHVATVLSTLVILNKEIVWLFKGLFKPLAPADGATSLYKRLSDEQRYVLNILVSMIPVGVVGLCFKDSIEALYADNILPVVGGCLLVTAALLAMTHFYKPQEKENISPIHAFIIGIAQAIAVLPGLSRSGSTIGTGLLLGNNRQSLAQFSFLMVIPPILGEALLDFKHIVSPSAEYLAEHGIEQPIETLPLIVGFIAAFISGCIACKWMIALVKRCKLIYFSIYCAIAGCIALYFSF
ncbi:MAG: undecaprenyl-diphosphate phosphatase [Paludibacteraceae bacterium]|nr:undecaprenyl-diphosphate phosphatase [Paludibacteraceae bacterium]